MKKDNTNKFPGLSSNWSSGYWKCPRMLDKYWYLLNGSEQKVFTFILRQTIGRNKMYDRITLDQFQFGIGENNNGTGLSRSRVGEAIKRLVRKGFIRKEKISARKVEYHLTVQKDNGDSSKTELDGSGNEPEDGSKRVSPIEDSNRRLTIEEIEKILSLYHEKVCAGARLTKEGKKMIAERLKEYTFNEIKEAIINFSRNTWWMENHAGEGIEWFFKSEGQVDKWINLPSSPEYREEKLRRYPSENLGD